jgi:hypothetical protein
LGKSIIDSLVRYTAPIQFYEYELKLLMQFIIQQTKLSAASVFFYTIAGGLFAVAYGGE